MSTSTETRTKTYQVCKMVAEQCTKEVQYTVCVPQTVTKTHQVTVCNRVPYEKEVTYTVCVPQQVTKEVDVRVCKMVQQTVMVPACAPRVRRCGLRRRACSTGCGTACSTGCGCN